MRNSILMILLMLTITTMAYIEKPPDSARAKPTLATSNTHYPERYLHAILHKREKVSIASSKWKSLGMFHATAYDLSIQSTGKSSTHPAYGITKSGISIKGKTLEEARAIAVDEDVIPLGTRVYVEFESDVYQHLNGFYTALDTGSAIIGNEIDVFMGDFVDEKPSAIAMKFGNQNANVYVEVNE
jgi:3D (Asp-Asp-Asp) domain-containing protein